MAIFGSARDVSMIRHVNRELLNDVISQQCAFYKPRLEETVTNVYGESAGEKYWMGPILLSCLLSRTDQAFPDTDLGIDADQAISFFLLRDDLVDANFVAEVGDVILYQENYYEVDVVISNQYFVGKNPDYPNESNPINPGLVDFGYNVSIICNTHLVPSDKLGISRERFI